MKTLLLILLCFGSLIGSAQQTDIIQSKTLVLAGPSPQTSIRLNDTMRVDNPGWLAMDSGIYNIKAWAPHYQLYEADVKLPPDSGNRLKIELKMLPEYKTYMARHAAWKKQQKKLLILPKAATAVFAGYVIWQAGQLRKNGDKYLAGALRAERLYQNSFTLESMALAKDSFSYFNDRYQNTRFKTNVFRPLAVLLIGGGIYYAVRLHKKARAIEEPVWKERPPRLTYLKLGAIPTDGVLAFSLQLGF